MPPPRGRASSSSSGRMGGSRGEVGPVQSHPSEHAEQQFDGLFRGIGVTSKEPICGKRSSSLKRLHDATHFAVGCEKWDGGGRGPSTAHEAYADPQVVYATVEAPDKNASMVELRQCRFDPEAHYRTEQRERFSELGAQPRDPLCTAASRASVHFGDHHRELVPHMVAVHRKFEEEESQRTAFLRAAGVGTLVPTGALPKPVRCNPVTGGPRLVDNHDFGMDRRMQFGRVTSDHGDIAGEDARRGAKDLLYWHLPGAAREGPRGGLRA